MTKWKFKGQDHSLGYRTGKIYDLTISGRTLSQRIFGQMVGIPFTWRVLVHSPMFCPYISWEAFNANWERVNDETK